MNSIIFITLNRYIKKIYLIVNLMKFVRHGNIDIFLYKLTQI
jgi:hypothetical protein